MAEDAIAKAGLYFDELNKIRVLDPEVAVQTSELKDECKDFLDSKHTYVYFIDCCNKPRPLGQRSDYIPYRPLKSITPHDRANLSSRALSDLSSYQLCSNAPGPVLLNSATALQRSYIMQLDERSKVYTSTIRKLHIV